MLEDYLQRREINLAAMRQAINLVAGGLVDYLVLGRDDCTPHGFARVDLRVLERDIQQRGLADRVDSYPGADELGAVLLARTVNDALERQPKIYTDWATPRGPEITALYEDVTLRENIRLHIKSAGGRMVDGAAEANLILAVNNPVDKVVEASMQPGETAPGEHHLVLVGRINEWLERSKPVAVADVAYTNGADRALMEVLAGNTCENNGVAPGINTVLTNSAARANESAGNSPQSNTKNKGSTGNQPAPAVRVGSCPLPRLAGYAGCNTAVNSTGMALAHGLLRSTAVDDSFNERKKSEEHRKYLLTRLVEDWGFQAVVRPALTARHPGVKGAGAVLDQETIIAVQNEITTGLNNFLQNEINTQFSKKNKVTNVTLPWNRLFDVRFLKLILETLPVPAQK